MEKKLVIDLFSGIGLLARAFRAEGFNVMRGPDTLFGEDVRECHLSPGIYWGVIFGSPCQDFSRARRAPQTGQGIELLQQGCRLIHEAQPEWFLVENVPAVPAVQIAGYAVQRFLLSGLEVGSLQYRLRCIQFGSRTGLALVTDRAQASRGASQPAVTCNDRRSWPELCELQGLPRDFDLPGWPLGFKRRALANGVPLPMGRALAHWVRDATTARTARRVTLCVCGCGRPVDGRTLSTATCRKRMERNRKSSLPVVTVPGL